MAQLAVQIEHRDLVPVVEIERNAEGSVDLTTMRREQRKAVVDVFLIDGPRREKVASFLIPSLPQVHGRKPLIQLTGSIEGKTAKLRLFVERRLVDTQEVDVRGALPRGAFLPALLIILLILLLGGGAYFLFFSGPAEEPDVPVADAGRPDAPAGDTAASERPADQEPATETPRVSRSQDQGQSPSGESTPESGISRREGGDREPGDATAPASEEDAGGVRESATPEESTPGGSSAAVVERDTASPGSPSPDSEAAPESVVSAEPSHSVYFRPNSAVLTPAAQEELNRVGQALSRQEVRALRIVGHTALAGTEAGRIELSWDRARAVQAFLSEGGSSAADQAQILGRGGDAPVTRERDLQHLNRRVEIYIRR